MADRQAKEAAAEMSAPDIPILPVLDKREAISEIKKTDGKQVEAQIFMLREDNLYPGHLYRSWEKKLLWGRGQGHVHCRESVVKWTHPSERPQIENKHDSIRTVRGMQCHRKY